MSNLIMITTTKFVGVDGTESYGWRVRDDHGQAYDDSYCLEDFNSKLLKDLEVFQELMKSDNNEVVEIIDYILTHGHAVMINSSVYSWDEIKHLFAYDEGKCPDCGEALPPEWHDGCECENCGHVFYDASRAAEKCPRCDCPKDNEKKCNNCGVLFSSEGSTED